MATEQARWQPLEYVRLQAVPANPGYLGVEDRGDDTFLILSDADETEIWRSNIPAQCRAVSLASASKIYLACDKGQAGHRASLLILDRETGKATNNIALPHPYIMMEEVWYSIPHHIENDTMVVVETANARKRESVTQSALVAWDPRSDRLANVTEFDGTIRDLKKIDSSYFVFTGSGPKGPAGVFRWNADDGKQVWRFDQPKTSSSLPVRITNDGLIFATEEGSACTIRSVDLLTGKAAWAADVYGHCYEIFALFEGDSLYMFSSLFSENLKVDLNQVTRIRLDGKILWSSRFQSDTDDHLMSFKIENDVIVVGLGYQDDGHRNYDQWNKFDLQTGQSR